MLPRRGDWAKILGDIQKCIDIIIIYASLRVSDEFSKHLSLLIWTSQRFDWINATKMCIITVSFNVLLILKRHFFLMSIWMQNAENIWPHASCLLKMNRGRVIFEWSLAWNMIHRCFSKQTKTSPHQTSKRNPPMPRIRSFIIYCDVSELHRTLNRETTT